MQNLLLEAKTPSLVVGDFNLWEDLGETDSFDWENFIEIWEELRSPEEEKYTWIGPDDGDPIFSKFDFTLLSKDSPYKATKIEWIGNYSIQKYKGDNPCKVNEDGI